MRLVVSTLLGLFISGLSFAEIIVQSPYTRATPPGLTTAAGYMVIENTSATPETIVSAVSNVAGITEIHQHSMDDRGVMKMRKVESVTVDGLATLVFEPGDYHLMLMNLKQPLRPSDVVEVGLKTSSGKTYHFNMVVTPLGEQAPMSHHHSQDKH